MQRMRAPDSSPPPSNAPPQSPAPAAAAPAPPPAPATPTAEAPRSAFPAQRFPLHYATNDDINRQLRDLLQRHPDKMWPPRTYTSITTFFFMNDLNLSSLLFTLFYRGGRGRRCDTRHEPRGPTVQAAVTGGAPPAYTTAARTEA